MVKHSLITIDVDCLCGAIGYINGGKQILKKDSRIVEISYNYWLPRFLNLLEDMNIKATFFLVADFARLRRNITLVKHIVDSGHEVASHTLNHPVNLLDLERKTQKNEIVESKKILEDITGKSVVGFRGPGYAIDREILEMLAESGYLYDSSIVPGFLFPIYKYIFGKLNQKRYGHPFILPNKPPIITKKPYILKLNNEKGILEIPINVLPIFPIPFVSWIIENRFKFNIFYKLIKAYSNTIIYEFHDIEFIDTERSDEFVCAELAKKMSKRRLNERIGFYEYILSTLERDCEFITGKEYTKHFLKIKS